MENLRNQRIKYALKKAKISQQELADALNLTDSAVNQRLNSEKPVDSIEYTFASLMDQAGANHTSLMKFMGLKKRGTLEKYVKTNGTLCMSSAALTQSI